MGQITRLYPDNSSGSFVDVPTADIDHFEKDLTPAAPASTPVTTFAPAAAPQVTPKLIAPSPKKTQNLNEVINSISDQHKIDPDLINSVIHAESGFNPRAVSPKGARGLMQLMPQTASQLGVANSFDPNANVEGGTKYLRELLERYNFDLVKALAAYNAGPQRVQQYHGVPPYYETRAYVARIVRDFNRKKLAQKKAAEAERKAAEKAARKAKAVKTAARKTASSKPPMASESLQQASR